MGKQRQALAIEGFVPLRDVARANGVRVETVRKWLKRNKLSKGRPWIYQVIAGIGYMNVKTADRFTRGEGRLGVSKRTIDELIDPVTTKECLEVLACDDNRFRKILDSLKIERVYHKGCAFIDRPELLYQVKPALEALMPPEDWISTRKIGFLLDRTGETARNWMKRNNAPLKMFIDPVTKELGVHVPKSFYERYKQVAKHTRQYKPNDPLKDTDYIKAVHHCNGAGYVTTKTVLDYLTKQGKKVNRSTVNNRLNKLAKRGHLAHKLADRKQTNLWASKVHGDSDSNTSS